MPDQVSTYKIACRGGLDTSRDVLAQGEFSPGSATQLINYEPAITGGYRRIDGFTNAYGTVPGTGSVLGVGVTAEINDGILACRTPSSGNNYVHRWDDATSAWIAITTSGSPTMTGVARVRFINFNFTTNKTILTDGINPAATYDGTTYTPITHAQAPAAPAYATGFKNHMFLAGDATGKNKLYFSAPLVESDFAPGNGAGVIQVGFDIVAIKPFRDTLYIFGQTEIKRLQGTSSADFVLESVTHELGCIAPDSVVEIGGDLIFLSQDGFRPVSGTNRIGDVELETISKDIQSLFPDIIRDSNLAALTAIVVRQKSQFRVLFAEASSTGIIAGLRKGEQGLVYEFGKLLGIEATSAASGYIGQYEYIIHGTTDGKVHRQEQGSSFAGTDILSVYKTPYVYMENTEQRKHFYKVTTYLRSEGVSNLILAVDYDYGDLYEASPTNYNLTTAGAAAYYREASYNSTASFSGNPSPIQSTNIEGSGKSIAFKYVTLGQGPSHSIQGIVLTFGLGDLR
jgi:hypothetical protein